MATKYWLGSSATPLVAQIAKAVFATYDVATTYKITIGGVVISQVGTGGTLTATLSALATALNASTHPYFSGITWSSTATEIIGTADTTGVGFSFTGSTSGGTGTCSTPFTITTAGSGPQWWNVATNWSDNAVPVNGDTVYIKNSTTSILWGLDQSAVTLTKLVIDKSFTGKIGLRHYEFATSADGATATANLNDPRDTYLKISATESHIGIFEGDGDVNGSGRIKIDFGSVSGQSCTVWDTASGATDTGYPSILLLMNHNTFNLYVRSAPAAVGVAKGAPNETSTLALCSISDDSENTQVQFGDGVTCTTWTQSGGDNILRAAATVTTVNVNGGNLVIEGDFTITTLNINGATVVDNHIKTSGNAVTTCNFYERGGSIDFTKSNVARTYATTNLKQQAALNFDKAVVTFTSLVMPDRKTILSVA